jgi:AraC family transcriptional regulator, regulatory protein of adaptative response / methylated-DNA-[protein]-cysteine methyltransferase
MARSGWHVQGTFCDIEPMTVSHDTQAAMDYARIEKVIEYLEAHWTEQPDLHTLACQIHLSPFHFQKLFTRWAGVSPAQFLRQLTRRAALERLRLGTPVLQTALDLGLSGPGRLHDLVLTTDGMTPGEIQKGGAQVQITHGTIATPFGPAWLAWTERGICALQFIASDQAEASLKQLQTIWPHAHFLLNKSMADRKAQNIFDGASPLHVRGTPFQIHVWRALLTIPHGALSTYQAVGASIGRPTASRAVGTAVGANPVAVLIPCHRVIRQTGVLGEYRWGSVRKKILTATEAATQSSQS